jgi:hypothetical protein
MRSSVPRSTGCRSSASSDCIATTGSCSTWVPISTKGTTAIQPSVTTTSALVGSRRKGSATTIMRPYDARMT